MWLARRTVHLCKGKAVDTLPIKSCVVAHVPFAGGLSQKKGVNPDTGQHQLIKYVKGVSCVDHFCPNCHKCPHCCSRSTCRGQIAQFVGKIGSPGGQSKGHNSPQGRLHPPLLNLAKSNKVTHYHKLQCKSPQEQLPDEALQKNAVELFKTQKSLEFYNKLFPQLVDAYSGPQYPEPISSNRKIQNGDTGNHEDLPPGRRVGHIHRFQRRILPHTDSKSVQEVHAFSRPGSVLPIWKWTCLPPGSTTNCLNLYHRFQAPGMDSRCSQSAPGGSGPLAFPPVAILGKVVEKLQYYLCRESF